MEDLRQFGRFLVVGCFNFVVSFAVFYLFYRHWRLSGALISPLGTVGESLGQLARGLGIDSADAALANVFGYSAGVGNSFVWNRYWTFTASHETRRQMGRFLLLNASLLLLSSASLFILTDALGWPYRPVWFVTMGLVTVINFLFSKHWVFRCTRD